ncbi:MAG: sulfatase-like hydrolase/transferase [Selenomonadaceae bacterium]|nr:sulfatase-like hydrolase/transferase [Selenomonadaceae bacterium]
MLFAYLENALKDLRLFFFVWILLNLYRIIFMYVMQDYIADANSGDIVRTLTAGAALSLKTAGFATLFSFAFVTLPKTIATRFKKGLPKIFEGLREKIAAFWLFVFTLLFLARFPYYKVFGATYDWQVFMGLNDDIGSVINMMFTEYGFLWRVPLAALLVYGLYKALLNFLNFDRFDLKLLNKAKDLKLKKDVAYFFAALALSVAFGIFARFGGAFSYSAGINWENAQTLTDKFLNECMLDDGQALYRAYSMEMRMSIAENLEVYPASINEFAGGKNIKTAEDLQPYLERKAAGERIEKPEHIFLIVGETFAAWPLFEEYESLGVGNYIKELSKEDKAFFYESALSYGEYTAMTLNGFITGLMDCKIRINYQPQSYKKPYVTAVAPQMKKLNYDTAFWYGGTLEWDQIGNLAKAQGFDKAYGYPEFNAKKQNTWGTTDRELFNAVFNSLDNNPSFHLIMTTSNHPPFNMNLAAEGIDAAAIRENLDNFSNITNPDDLTVELSYYSYMDREIYNFIKKTVEKYPKSLFVVTGDHSVRMLPGSKYTDREYVAVPILFYGYGVNKNLLNKDALPMHANIFPTLAELIAPKDFSYYSIMPSVFQTNEFAVMNEYYMDKNEVRKLYKAKSNGEAAYESFRVKTLSWWLMEK